MTADDAEQVVGFLESHARPSQAQPRLPPLWRASLAASGMLVIACGGVGALLRGARRRGAAGDAGGTTALNGRFGCSDRKDCDECASSPSCQWCPGDHKCRDFGSLVDSCSAPIKETLQCRGESCPQQVVGLMSNRVHDAGVLIEQTLTRQADALLDFRTYLEGTTGLFDLASGRALASAEEGDTAPDGYRVALLADWGSGTCDARSVAALVAARDPHMSVHLGGVYSIGTKEEYKTNFAGQKSDDGKDGISFPKGNVVTFAMAGSCEAISGFSGLYKTGFAYTGQTTTYAVWQSDKWRVVALDTGRQSYSTSVEGIHDIEREGGESDAPMPNDVMDWLINVVKLGDINDKRGVILLSHHQPYDGFSKAHMGAAKQLNRILPKGKEVIWFFGHNHVLAIYKKMQLEGLDFVIHPRLIGIGGFPNTVKTPLREEGLVAFDGRTYRTVPGEGGVDRAIGFNGYASMTITGDEIDVSYITGDCDEGDCTRGLSETESTVVATETFALDPSTGSIASETLYIAPELTHLGERAAFVV